MPAVKLDENVPDSVGTILRAAGHDVALARDQQLTGVADDRPPRKRRLWIVEPAAFEFGAPGHRLSDTPMEPTA